MMSTLGTTLGLALATTAAVYVVVSVANQKPVNGTSTHERNQRVPSVQFVLYTRNSTAVNLRIGDVEIFNSSGFDPEEPIKIITHGFLSSLQEEIFTLIRDSYLDTGNFNVIGVDWSILCKTEYLSALRGVQITGTLLAQFIDWLVEIGANLDNIHLIGHSLGAHVMGVAGERLRTGKVGRITGLDPAGPGFNDIRTDLKLDPEDGRLVDVIHTYMNILSLDHPVGHLDFYPNGGRYQPGCPDIYEIWKFSNSLLCNHGRSYLLFAESIRNKRAFKSKRCNSVEEALHSRCFEETEVYMGQPETYTNYGLYYFKTTATSPYSL